MYVMTSGEEVKRYGGKDREGERERERERERQTDRQRERQTDRQRAGVRGKEEGAMFT